MFLFAMATNCQEVVTQQTEKKKVKWINEHAKVEKQNQYLTFQCVLWDSMWTRVNLSKLNTKHTTQHNRTLIINGYVW